MRFRFLEERRTTDQIRLQIVDNMIYANLRDIYDLLQQMMVDNNSPNAGGRHAQLVAHRTEIREF